MDHPEALTEMIVLSFVLIVSILPKAFKSLATARLHQPL